MTNAYLPKLPRLALLLALLLPGTFFHRALAQQNVGIGTTAPTQTLDVNGNLRVRGLNGSGNRLPMILPDGTLGVNAPVYSTGPSTVAPVAAGPAVPTGTQPTSVAVSGTTAYVVNNTSSTLQVFNAATPSAPVLIASVPTGNNPGGVAVSGTRAYVVSSGNTLQIFDVTTPSAPTLLGSVPTGINPSGVAVSGTTAYVVSYSSNLLQVFNVATPSAPALQGSVTTGTAPFSIAVSGTRAYVVTANSNTLQVFNVATPTAPALLGQVATGGQPLSVAASGTTAYVANNGSSTLQVFSAATNTPVLVGTATTGTSARSVALSGTTAYVTSGTGNTLQLFDVSTPSAPVLLGSVATGNNPASVAVNGTTAYVVNGSGNTLQVFQQPNVRVTTVNPDGSLSSVPAPTLSISGQDLSITGGNTVTLPSNTGPMGPQGPTGAAGAQGPIGPQGPTGATGAAGTNGAVGPIGPQGPAGTNGTNGTNASVTGNNGVSVTSGVVKLGGNALTATTDIPLNSQNLTFSGTGNVGIGTASPTVPLDVNGAARIAGNSTVGGNEAVTGTSTITGLLTANGGATVVGTTNVNAGTGTGATNIGTGANAGVTNIGTGTSAGAVTIGRTGGNTQLFGPTSIVGTATINGGTSTAATNIGTGSGAGAVSIGRSGGTVGITGTTTVTGNTSITGNTSTTGTLQVGSLAGTGNRLPMVLPDGTFAINAPVFSTGPTAIVPTGAAGSVVINSTPVDVEVSGTTAYVVNIGGSLQTFSVAGTGNPVLLGSVATNSAPYGVAVSGTTAYVVSNNSNTLQVFNVATPSAPVLVGTVGTGVNPQSVVVSGTKAYVVNITSNTLQVFDVATPATPTLLGTVSTGAGSGPVSVVVSGTKAYVVNSTGNSLQVFDVSGAGNPVLLGTATTGAQPFGVAVSGTTAYVVNRTGNSFQTFDVTTPSTPTLLATVSTGAGSLPVSVAVNGNTAYVTNSTTNTLQLFNVSIPSAPTSLGTVGTDAGPRSVAVSGTTAYVVNATGNTLQVFQSPTGRTVAVNPDGSFASVALPTGADFIQNTTTQQAGSNFNISGNGTIGGNQTVAGSSTVAGAVQAGTNVFVDGAAGNTGTAANTLRFGGSTSGEGIGSKRNGGGNQYGLDFYTSSANRMSITGGGSVGIGTTAPATNLDVRTADNSAAITVGRTDGTAGALYFGNPGHGVKRSYNGANDVGFYTTAGNLYLAANGAVANQFVLTTAGNVGIGTTAPATALDVTSSAGTQLTVTSTAGDPNGVIAITVPNTNTACAGCSELIQFNRAGYGGIGSITMNAAGTGINYVNTSDKRLKEHVGRTRFGLADLLKLEVKDYNFIGQPASLRNTGFLAQDLFKVYPEAVKEGDYGTTVTNQWGVDYGKLTPLLVQAIQDQQALIVAQQDELDALKQQNAALQTGSATDHASLLTLQAQMARLLGTDTQAHK